MSFFKKFGMFCAVFFFLSFVFGMYQYIFYFVYYFTHYIVIKYNFPVHARGGTGASLTAVVAEARGGDGGVLRGMARAAEASLRDGGGAGGSRRGCGRP